MATAAEIVAQPAEERSAPIETEQFRKDRPSVVGPPQPGFPFPIFLQGAVQKGFGRGGKDLGCPTANLPDDSIQSMSNTTQTGVYYGYAQVIPPAETPTDLCVDDLKVFPMVMSLGWNPFYRNEKLTAEIHILHEFRSDFYGYEMKALVLGYIRPELDYTSREGLINDIEFDKKVALNCLERPGYSQYRADEKFVVC
ncbi:riboflavin kinase [Flagelloscypha sp. PMI_526]|nr:riboflavin kinase [Flagelloscypha sp. PMI_526]